MAESDELGEFSRWIRLRAVEVDTNSTALVRAAASTLLTRLVAATPVDTGRARAGWSISNGSPPSGQEPAQIATVRAGRVVREPFPLRTGSRTAARLASPGYPGAPRRAFRVAQNPATGRAQRIPIPARPALPPRPTVGMLFGPVGAASDAEAQTLLQALRGDLSRYRGGQGGVYVYNNVPYIVFLNQGHSRQADAGFIERCIMETEASLEGVTIVGR